MGSVHLLIDYCNDTEYKAVKQYLVSMPRISYEDVAKTFPEIELIKDQKLKSMILETWVRAIEASPYRTIDEARNFPARDYPTKGEYHPEMTQVSIVAHTRGVVRNALAIAETASDFHGISVDKDHLVAGGLIHDLDKLVKIQQIDKQFTFVPDESFPEGSADALMRRIAREVGLPEKYVEIIAPARKIPRKTIEDVILLHADLADADVWRKTFKASQLILDHFS